MLINEDNTQRSGVIKNQIFWKELNHEKSKNESKKVYQQESTTERTKPPLSLINIC
jgi:hypothetical protein